MLETRIDTAKTVGLFAPRRTGHVNLYVANLDAAMRFYTEVAGLEEVYRTPLVGGGFVSNGNTHHDLGFVTADGPAGRPRNAKPGQLNHLGFEMETEAEMVADYERAIAGGQTFLRTSDHDISHSIYGADPDGNTYELYADVVQDWRNRRSGTITKAKPNWTPGSTPPVAIPMYEDAPELRRVEPALFHTSRCAGATLVVADLAASTRHYTKVVGLTLLSTGADGQIAVLAGSCGNPSLTLIQAGPSRPAGYHHVSLQVDDPADLASSVERARREGFPIAVEMTDLGRHAVTVKDPDGFFVQFYSDANGEPDPGAVNADQALYLL